MFRDAGHGVQEWGSK